MSSNYTEMWHNISPLIIACGIVWNARKPLYFEMRNWMNLIYSIYPHMLIWALFISAHIFAVLVEAQIQHVFIWKWQHLNHFSTKTKQKLLAVFIAFSIRPKGQQFHRVWWTNSSARRKISALGLNFSFNTPCYTHVTTIMKIRYDKLLRLCLRLSHSIGHKRTIEIKERSV